MDRQSSGIGVGFPEDSLVPGRHYTRPELRSLAGLPQRGGDFDTGYARVGDEWVIFANLGGSRNGHDYPNRWTAQGLAWFGKTNSRPSDSQIRAMTSGATVHLFTRDMDRDPWQYHGRVTPAHGPEGERPVRVVWHLQGEGEGEGVPSADESPLAGSRPAYLLTWNPDLWEWPDYSGYVRAVQHGLGEAMSWSVGNRRTLPAGSRLFLVRLGRPPKGIIGSGIAAEGLHEELHWDLERAARGEMSPQTTIQFDVLLDADVVAPFRPGASGVPILEAFDWSPQRSGVEIPSGVADALERAWVQYTAEIQHQTSSLVPVPMAELPSVLIRLGEAGSVVRATQATEREGSSVSGRSSRRRSSAAKQVGDRAELLVKRHLEDSLHESLRSTIRHHAANGETPGYDLSYGEGDSLVAVEVKGSVQSAITSVELTANEWQAATSLGARYHLYVVGNANSSRPVIEVIENPAIRLSVEPAVYRARLPQA